MNACSGTSRYNMVVSVLKLARFSGMMELPTIVDVKGAPRRVCPATWHNGMLWMDEVDERRSGQEMQVIDMSCTIVVGDQGTGHKDKTSHLILRRFTSVGLPT